MVSSVYQDAFRMPTTMKIMRRTSSITNAFVSGIIPAIPPTDAEIETALRILGMRADDIRCSYCGGEASEWDHLRPIVKNRRPTGYISEIRNLVPACGKCNQSKGNKDWRSWMTSTASRSPRMQGVSDLDERTARLDRFEQWGNVQPLDLCEIVGGTAWRDHWDHLNEIEKLMRLAHEHAEVMRERIETSMNGTREPECGGSDSAQR